MPVHGVCRNFVLLSLQLKTKKRKKVGMKRKPSYLCIVKSQEHDSRQQSKSDLKIKIVLTIKN